MYTSMCQKHKYAMRKGLLKPEDVQRLTPWVFLCQTTETLARPQIEAGFVSCGVVRGCKSLILHDCNIKMQKPEDLIISSPQTFHSLLQSNAEKYLDLDVSFHICCAQNWYCCQSCGFIVAYYKELGTIWWNKWSNKKRLTGHALSPVCLC